MRQRPSVGEVAEESFDVAMRAFIGVIVVFAAYAVFHPELAPMADAPPWWHLAWLGARAGVFYGAIAAAIAVGATIALSVIGRRADAR